MSRPGWSQYYLDICKVVSSRASCVKRQIGCVITVDNRIVSTGYNGTPRGIKNCDEGGCSRCNDATIPSGTRLDECLCSHAEENAIVQAAYHGVSLRGATLYTQISPCIWCSKMIINAGITTVVFGKMYSQDSLMMLDKARVNCNEYIER